MSGGVATSVIEEAIKNEFSPSVLYADDLSDGCGAKFGLIIVSDAFEGVSLLERQQRVFAALKPYMERIHAVTMKCLTSKQWETRKDTLLAERQSS